MERLAVVTNSKNPHLVERSSDSGEYGALARAAVAGDAQAMERLLVRAQEVAYRFSLLVCGHEEDAEDVMQEALLKTYQHVKHIRKPDAFRTWLYRTVRNACLMKRRRRVHEPARLVSIEQGMSHGDGEGGPVDVEDHARPADQRLIDSWIGGRLRRALAALPPSYRVILVLREMEGLSTREVAAVTGLSEANVKTRLHRVRVMLRNQLEGV